MDMLEKLTPTDKRFGMNAVEKGFITKEQLLEALRIQVEENVEHGTHRFIGEILVDMKVISLEKLPPAEKRFGMIAIEKGFITKEQLIDALKTQVEEELECGSHSFIGSILVKKKAINPKQLGAVCVEMGIGRGTYD